MGEQEVELILLGEEGEPGLVDSGKVPYSGIKMSSTIYNYIGPKAPCRCQVRQLPDKLTSKFPFKDIPENSEKIQLWLKSFFAASAFNMCERQKLTLMEGLPSI